MDHEFGCHFRVLAKSIIHSFFLFISKLLSTYCGSKEVVRGWMGEEKRERGVPMY